MKPIRRDNRDRYHKQVAQMWTAMTRPADGEPCPHPGCLSHLSHPCEGCGRIAGRALIPQMRRYYLLIRGGHAYTEEGVYFGPASFGLAYRSGYGDTRASVTITARNNHTYTGTYYESAGGYARVRLTKDDAWKEKHAY